MCDFLVIGIKIQLVVQYILRKKYMLRDFRSDAISIVSIIFIHVTWISNWLELNCFNFVLLTLETLVRKHKVVVLIALIDSKLDWIKCSGVNSNKKTQLVVYRTFKHDEWPQRRDFFSLSSYEGNNIYHGAKHGCQFNVFTFHNIGSSGWAFIGERL